MSHLGPKPQRDRIVRFIARVPRPVVVIPSCEDLTAGELRPRFVEWHRSFHGLAIQSHPLRLLPAGARVAGRNSHPVDSGFPRRTVSSVMEPSGTGMDLNKDEQQDLHLMVQRLGVSAAEEAPLPLVHALAMGDAGRVEGSAGAQIVGAHQEAAANATQEIGLARLQRD